MQTTKALDWAFNRGWEAGIKHERGVAALKSDRRASDEPDQSAALAAAARSRYKDGYRAGYNDALNRAVDLLVANAAELGLSNDAVQAIETRANKEKQ